MAGRQESNRQEIYHIRVRGTLDSKWSDWFGGLTILPQPGGETLLTGQVADQAALHGLLARIRDMGLPLLSVKRLEIEEKEAFKHSDELGE
jgi:hypothetical protein